MAIGESEGRSVEDTAVNSRGVEVAPGVDLGSVDVSEMPLSKRLFDVVVCSFVLLISLPLSICLALAIKLDSPGPIFYLDERVGKGGDLFRLFKFRSMVVNASEMGWNITVEGDPRITRVGAFLRTWKLDELPNILNILAGDMSIVGPRPEVPEYIQYYTEEEMEILSVEPGMIDHAISEVYRNEQQILSEVDDARSFYVTHVMRDKLERNLRYVRGSRSLAGDMRIIWRGLKIVVLGHDSRGKSA